MELYCVSTNSTQPWGFERHMAYLGTSLEEALKTVGKFVEYEAKFPLTQYPSVYSVLPLSIPREYLKYYEADGRWMSIARFTIE